MNREKNGIPNRFLFNKWKAHEQGIHLRKLERIKPVIQNTPPQLYRHLLNKRKKEQLLEGLFFPP
jgi:hypothetical protein